MVAGTWWRASGYELLPGSMGWLVAPVRDAAVTRYDPWEGWNAPRGVRRDEPAYVQLASLAPLEALVIDENRVALPGRPPPEVEQAVLAFVGRWGLLGTALAELERIRLPSGDFWRVGADWHGHDQGGPLALTRMTVRGPAHSGEDDQWWRSHHRPVRGRGGEWYTPGWREPLGSDAFVASYSEPVWEILLAARRVESLLEHLAALNAPGGGIHVFDETEAADVDLTPDPLDGARSLAARLCAHVGPTIEQAPCSVGEQGVRVVWRAGTLLETCGLQAVLDADRHPVRRCPACGSWFRQLQDRPVMFCSVNCQKNGARRRRLEARGPVKRGRPREGGAS